MWFEGPVVKVAFTGDLEKHREATRSLIGDHPAQLVQVKYTMLELSRVQGLISRDIRWLAMQGIRVSAWGVQENENKVFLMVAKSTTRTVRVLEERYGDDILLIQEGIMRRV